ncbi:MAG: hypothetical protein J3Q66DRAFT_402767 [Benniella sp.]|nr:MAG: hypothetical protein J3Q66DRAFT_402767 [Benniella sp.]
MLAGSGLCFLVAAHLMMIHLVNNEHNSTYNRMLHDPTLVASPAILEVMTTTTTTTSFSADASAAIPSSFMPVPVLSSPLSLLINVPIQELESHAFENKEQELDQDQEEEEEEEKEKAVGLRWKEKRNQKRDRRVDHSPWPKIHIPTHLLMKPSDPPPALDKATPDLELDPRPHGEVGPWVDLQREHDIPSSHQQQQPFMASDGATVVMVANTPNSQPNVLIGDDVSTNHSVSESPVDAPSSSSSSFNHLDQIQSDPSPGEAFTTLDPEPAQHPVPASYDEDASSSERIAREQAFLHPSSPSSNSITTTTTTTTTTSSSSLSGSSYYTLTSLHWMVYAASQCFLVSLLVMMFLGVLILMEYVLDREDEDLVNLKYHYWGRVVGIVTATIVSAIHGSVLSGYVLLDGHSDWIAKAVVGTICTYWITMTWAMHRVAGPLPY